MRCSMKRIDKENIKVNQWAGGETKEFYIYPEGSLLKNRDFLFRISSASSNLSLSEFSNFDGYQRILVVLEGHIKLVHNQQRHVSLSPFEQDHFNGEDVTECYGAMVDFNVITRKNLYHSVEVLYLDNDTIGFVPNLKKVGNHFIFLYVAQGSISIEHSSEKIELLKGDLCELVSIEEAYELSADEKAVGMVIHVIV